MFLTYQIYSILQEYISIANHYLCVIIFICLSGGKELRHERIDSSVLYEMNDLMVLKSPEIKPFLLTRTPRSLVQLRIYRLSVSIHPVIS